MDNTDKRLFLLFGIDAFSAPIKKEQLATILVSTTKLSWIDVQLTIESLVEDKLLAENKNNKLEITSKGLQIVDVYRKKVPKNLREKIKAYINDHKSQLLGETISHSHFKAEGHNYRVHLELIETSQLLVEMDLLVPNREEAERICNSWRERPQEIYRSLLNSFSDTL